MRVVMALISDLDMTAGGIETWVQYFVPALLRSDPTLELTIICRDGGNATDLAVGALEARTDAGDRLHVERVRLEGTGWPQSPRMVPYARGFPRAVKRLAHAGMVPDVWLSIGGLQVASAMHLTRRMRRLEHRAPDVHWARSVFTREVSHRVGALGRSVLLSIERRIYRSYDGFIANGWDTADFYRELGLQPYVNPNAVDVNRWPVDDEGPWHGPTHVVWTDRLARVKGIEAFLDACRRCEPEVRHGTLVFHVFGDGPHTPQVREFQELGLLQYHGRVPNADLPRLTRGMQVACALTHLDGDRGTGGGGVPHSLLEQLAAGRIVIGWSNAHLGQALSDANGIVLPQGDSGALATVLQDICAQPDKFAHLRRAARETAERFSVEQHVASTLRYLHAVQVSPEHARTLEGAPRPVAHGH